jgi:hypothetical protein
MGGNGHLLTGADHFHLLIDRQMRQKGLPGNISRFHLQLAHSADLGRLADALRNDPTLNRVSRLRLQHCWPNAPKWLETGDVSDAAFLHSGISLGSFGSTVLNASVSATSIPVRIDLCALDDGSKHLVISMHHALFDHRGMRLFLRSLADGTAPAQFFIFHGKRKWASEVAGAVRGMLSALGSGGWRLAALADKSTAISGQPIFYDIGLTEEETVRSDASAHAAGSRPGRSAFYLAATLVALRELLDARGRHPPYFWVPVPHDMRRRGGEGHLVGNDLSFLFFKLLREDQLTVGQAVAAIQRQLTGQVRKGVLHHQAAVQRAFRFIPFWLMNAMVGLTTGGRVSTLAFSDLGEERDPVTSFRGEEVLRSSHIPPVPFPPGLSVVFLRDNGRQRLVLGCYGEVIPGQEMEVFRDRLRCLLTT